MEILTQKKNIEDEFAAAAKAAHPEQTVVRKQEISSSSTENDDTPDPLANAAKEKLQIIDVNGNHTDITDAEKEAFLNAIVSGDRMRLKVSLFGGRMNMVLRSRSNEETDAIVSYLSRMAQRRKITTNSEYASLARLAMICAQVEKLDGVEYPEMKKPLFFTEDKEKISSPAWVQDMDEIWAKKSEALIMAISNELIDFEKKYWKMITNSKNENFWNPGESTGELKK